MTQRPTDTRRASVVIVKNIKRIVLTMGVVLLAAYLVARSDGPGDPSGQWTQIGTRPIVYDRSRAAEMLYTETADDRVPRIEVLDSGLIAGRGIVAVPFDSDTPRQDCRNAVVRLIVADAWERLYEYFVPRHGSRSNCRAIPPGKLPNLDVCPYGVCDDVDHRGIALVPTGKGETRLVVADAHQQRLSLRDLKGNIVGTLGGPQLFTGVTAVTRSPGGSVFVTTAPTETERARALREGKRAMGKLFTLEVNSDAKDALPTEIAGELERPVGIAYSSCPPRLYVTDATEEQTVWYYYEPTGVPGAPSEAKRQWQRAGVLASEAADLAATPPVLQGIAIGKCTKKADGTPAGGEVFAAGPGGLFVYRPDGTLIARYVLSERISGLAWGADRALYMTVGHRIARLITKVGGDDVPAESEPGTEAGSP